MSEKWITFQLLHCGDRIESLPCRSQLKGANFFTKLDTTSAYWNVSLSEQSSYLTTFNTCYGRYRYLRLPMGLKSSMDILSRKMDKTFENIPGIVVIIDDILVFGKTRQELTVWRLFCKGLWTRASGWMRKNLRLASLKSAIMGMFCRSMAWNRILPKSKQSKTCHLQKIGQNLANKWNFTGVNLRKRHSPRLKKSLHRNRVKY